MERQKICSKYAYINGALTHQYAEPTQSLCINALMTTHEIARQEDEAAQRFRNRMHAYFSSCTRTRWVLEENDAYNYDSIKLVAARDNNMIFRIIIRPAEIRSKIKVSVYELYGWAPSFEFVAGHRSDIVDWLEVFCP